MEPKCKLNSNVDVVGVAAGVNPWQMAFIVVTSDKGGTCFCPCLFVCLFVCLLARLLKNAWMDFDEMLRVDRCRDMDEMINF